jgi:5'-nucleotidase
MNRVALATLLTLGSLLSACVPSASQTAPSGPLTVKVLGFNDFHGNLLPNLLRYPDPNNPSNSIAVQAGGIEYVSTVIKGIKANHPNTVVVGAGDLVSASPLISNLLLDEPTVDALSKIGLEFSSVGNHEFDRSFKELMRLQRGGCAEASEPAKACKYSASFAGAKFQYLAANVLDKATGKPAMPAYAVKNLDGVDIGFIGAVLVDTPTIVTPSGIMGLEFTDEATAINKASAELRARGVETQIVLIHQGGTAIDPFYVKDCKTLSGPIVDISRKLDKAIDAIISGHTHRGYQCRVDGRLITQSGQYGNVVMEVTLTIDRATRDVTATDSNAILVDSTKIAKDAAMSEIVNRSKGLTDSIAGQVIGKIAVEQISRDLNRAGESPLGQVIADAQLFASKEANKGSAVIAFMNPGGVRAALPPNPSAGKSVTFGDSFTVQPFGNSLVVMTLTGAQIKTLLEQQWLNQDRPRILHISEGFSYTYDDSKPAGEKVVASTMKLGTETLDPAKSYRIVVNSFLADGGDRFEVLKAGTNRLGGELDLDALQAYLAAMEKAGKPVGQQTLNRITAINQK